MRIATTFAAGLVLALAGAAPALADGVKIYPFASAESYCPDGLQPVSIAGVICCGTPDQSMTYQQVMRHPVRVAARAPKSEAKVCPEGEKGCS